MGGRGRFPRLVVYHPSHADRYADWLNRHQVPSVTAVSLPEQLLPLAEDAEVVACWDFPAQMWPKLKHLRWVQVLAAGVDHLLGETALAQDVQICRAVGPFGQQMAEWALAEMLYQARGLAPLRSQQAGANWQRFVPGTLAKSVLGIAGMGAIGQEVARRAKAFGLTVHALSRQNDSRLADRIYRPTQWTEFAGSCDWLLLLLPLTAETRGVVGERVLAAMRPTAWLMNAGRGALVDEAALLAALDRASLSGAILDVFREEPLPSDHPFWHHPKVIVTPHLAAVSRLEDMAEILYQNLCRDRDGEPLQYVVDRTRGY